MEKPGLTVLMGMCPKFANARPGSDTETLPQPHGRYLGVVHLELFLVAFQYLAIRNMVSKKRVNAAAPLL